LTLGPLIFGSNRDFQGVVLDHLGVEAKASCRVKERSAVFMQFLDSATTAVRLRHRISHQLLTSQPLSMKSTASQPSSSG
jgi:hypothetical protein